MRIEVRATGRNSDMDPAQIAKLPLVDMLKLGMQIEYSTVVNYPRVIDRIVHHERIATENDEAVKSLEELGKASIKHPDMTATLIRQLGGEPQFDFDVLEAPMDSARWLMAQRESEKLMLSVYEEAKRLAQQTQTHSFLEKVRRVFLFSRQQANVVANQYTIDILDRLIADETHHLELIDEVIRKLVR